MSENGKVCLNIGAGGVEVPDHVPIDRKNGSEAYPLTAYADESVDEIRASHVLEHFGTGVILDVVRDWTRTLKPGGRLRLAVPDMDWIANAKHHGLANPDVLMAYQMGGQTDNNDFHFSAFDERRLRMVMNAAGLERIQPWESDVEDCAQLPVSLNLEGYKRRPRESFKIPHTIGVMSTGRVGFTENLFCAANVFHAHNIQLYKHTGAYWGPCMERVMTDAVKDGAEWIVTLDYDTVFAQEMFDELAYLMVEHPEADAIAPWQVKREQDEMLVWMSDGNGEHRQIVPLDEFEADITPVDTAHFGLTFLRVESLKKMPHPWFRGVPGKDDKWEDGRIDEDIYFWNQWQKIGNTLYMANKVSIGHCQQLVSWPDKNFKPVHQYITDFQKYGKPQVAR